MVKRATMIQATIPWTACLAVPLILHPMRHRGETLTLYLRYQRYRRQHRVKVKRIWLSLYKHAPASIDFGESLMKLFERSAVMLKAHMQFVDPGLSRHMLDRR